MNDHKILDAPLPVRAVIAGGFALLVVVVAATWTVASEVRSNQIAALQGQIDVTKKSKESEAIRGLPGPTLESVSNKEELGDLSSRISTLERERNVLLSELSRLSTAALLPSSELGGLISQLKDAAVSKRQAAAIGLFELDDPRAVSALVAYYWSNPEEATRVILATKYMNFAWYHNHAAGLDFMTRILQSDQAQHAGWAYEEIVEKVSEKDFDEFVPVIQGIALRSENALVRTRAKLIIQEHTKWKEREKRESKKSTKSS